MTDLTWGDDLPAEPAPPPAPFAQDYNNFTSHTIMAEDWDIEAVVLIIDRRLCTCGRHYDTPNPQVMIRKRRQRHQLKQLHLERLAPGAGLPYDVPRELEYINSHVNACPSCFKLYSPSGQFELFPHTKPPTPRPRKAPSAADEIIPYTLEDFA